MSKPRILSVAVIPLTLLVTAKAPGQSVVSARSGLVYFFEGSVFLGDQQLNQRFGRFPEIGEGGELRTERGRAEVLLTPGVFLRLNDSSRIRLLSDKITDSRVELLSGSALLESDQTGAPVSVKFRSWTVHVPQAGVYRLDTAPAQLITYKGDVQVTAEGASDPVALKAGETLPLADILVPDQSKPDDEDAFKKWAMGRSQAIVADNATATGILDDPSQVDSSGVAVAGGLSYFPLTSLPSLGYYPYGVSFWSPYQSTLSSLYFPPTLAWGGPYSYYGSAGSRLPLVIRRPVIPYTGGSFYNPASPASGLYVPGRIGSSVRPGGISSPGLSMPVTPIRPPVHVPSPVSPHPTMHGAIHAGAHR